MLLLGIAREVSLRWRQRSMSQQLRAANARVAALEASASAAAPPPVETALMPAGPRPGVIPVAAEEPPPA